MSRPRYPKADENNRIVIDALEDISGCTITPDAARLRYVVMIHGQILTALKIADLPGQIDWLVLSDAGWYLPIEVKQPGKERDLTGGELSWAGMLGVLIASNVDAVKYAILERLNG